jgi:hypothetical protein
MHQRESHDETIEDRRKMTRFGGFFHALFDEFCEFCAEKSFVRPAPLRFYARKMLKIGGNP